MHQVVNIGADRNGGTQRDGYNGYKIAALQNLTWYIIRFMNERFIFQG